MIGDNGERRKGERERGKGYLPWRNKELPRDKVETNMAHSQKAVNKQKWGGEPVLG